MRRPDDFNTEFDRIQDKVNRGMKWAAFFGVLQSIFWAGVVVFLLYLLWKNFG